MAELFPSTLQDKLNQSGFTFDFGNRTIRSETDVGLAKVRARYTKAIDKVSASITVDHSEFTTINTFYNTTLKGGEKTFLYNHPFTGMAQEFRFLAPPKLDPLGGLKYNLSMTWEIIP